MYRYWKDDGKSPWKLIKNDKASMEKAIADGAKFFTVLSLDQDLSRLSDEDDEKQKIYYKGPLYFDLDSKDDESRTLFDVRKLVLKLYTDYGVNLNNIQIFCTGSKGFHVLVPAKVFSDGKAKQFLPYTYKNMALEFELETLDWSIYSGGKGRMWRIENIKRSNDRYKVRLSAHQIFSCTFEEILELTKSPGEPVEEPKEVDFSAELSALFRAKEYKPPKLSAKGVEDAKLRALEKTPACMQKLSKLEAIQEGRSFNQIVMAFASYGAGMGWTFDQLEEFAHFAISEYASSVYKSTRDKMGHVRGIFGYYLSQKNYRFNCRFIKKTVQCESDCPKCELTAKVMDEEYDPTLGIEVTATAYFKRQGDARTQLSTFVIKPKSVIEFVDKHYQTEYTICAALEAATGRKQDVIFYQPDWASRTNFLKKLPHPDFAYVGGDIDVSKIFHVISQLGDIPKRTGVKCMGMHEIKGKWHFVTHDGSVASDGGYNEVILENEYQLDTDLVMTQLPTVEDVKRVMQDLFRFNSLEIAVPLVGWFVASFFKERIFKLTRQFPLLFVFGAAGAGKTQTLLTLKNLYALRSDNIKSIADVTAFTLIKAADANNTIPLILDEFKATTFSQYQVKMVSKLIRAAYNNEVGERGQANQTVTQYHYRSPIILAGEQTVTEPAARDRIIEVHMNKRTSAPHLDDFKSLQKAPLDRFGRLILSRALAITDDEMIVMLERCQADVPEFYTDRPRLNQAIIMLGIKLLEQIVEPYGFAGQVTGAWERYCMRQFDIEKDEIVERNKSDVDRILEAISLMSEHERYKLWPKQQFVIEGNKLIINMRLVYSSYLRFAEEYRVDSEPMNYTSFLKLVKKEPYFIKDGTIFPMAEGMKICMELDIDKLQAKNLNLLSILAGEATAEDKLEV